MSAFPHPHRSRQGVFDHPFFTQPFMDPFGSHRVTSPVFDMLCPGHAEAPRHAEYGHNRRPHIRELHPTEEIDDDEEHQVSHHNPLIEEPEDTEHERSAKRRHWEESNAKVSRAPRQEQPQQPPRTFRFVSTSSAYGSRQGGFVQSSSSTLRDFNGIQETTHSSYDSRTGQQQSLHSRRLPDRQGHTVTSHQQGRQSEARVNHMLHNLDPEGLPGFERDWERLHQARFPMQSSWDAAGFGSPGMINIMGSSGRAARRGREIPIE